VIQPPPLGPIRTQRFFFSPPSSAFSASHISVSDEAIRVEREVQRLVVFFALEPRGGYGYVTPVAGVVTKIGPQKVQIRVGLGRARPPAGLAACVGCNKASNRIWCHKAAAAGNTFTTAELYPYVLAALQISTGGSSKSSRCSGPFAAHTCCYRRGPKS
jgi:hypothetical protein